MDLRPPRYWSTHAAVLLFVSPSRSTVVISKGIID